MSEDMESSGIEANKAKEKEPKSRKIKVVAWNAGLQNYEGLSSAVNEFLSSEVDIIAIQETGSKVNANGKINFRQLEEDLKDEFEVYFSGSSREYVNKRRFHRLGDMREEEGGLTLIVRKSKATVNIVQPITLPRLPELSIIEKQKTYGGRPDERHAQVAEVKVGNKYIVFVNTHFDWQGGMEQKIRQAEFLGKYIGQKVNNDGVFIVGDINVVNNKGAKEVASAMTYDKSVREVIPPEPTVKIAGVVGMKPDLAFVQGEIKVDKVTTMDESYGSDHRPVVYDLTI